MSLTRRELLRFLPAGLAAPLLLSTGFSAEAASPLKIGPRVRLGVSQAEGEEEPIVTPLVTGGFALGWHSDAGGNTKSYARRFAPTGGGASAAVVIPGYRTPTILGNADGTSLVIYEDSGINAQKMTKAFAADGSPIILQASGKKKGDPLSTNLHAARLKGGNILVCWSTGTFSGYSLNMTVVSGTGLSITPAKIILTDKLINILGITALTDGNAAILYVEKTPDYHYLTKAVFLSPTGAVLGKTRTIRDSEDSGDLAAFAATAKGGIVCTWTDFSDFSGTRQRGQFFGAKGVAGKTFKTGFDDKFGGQPGVAVDRKGRVLVTHSGVGKVVGGHAYNGPFISLFSPTGAQIGKSLALDTPLYLEGPYSTAIVQQKDGSFIAIWNVGAPKSSEERVYGRRITIT